MPDDGSSFQLIKLPHSAHHFVILWYTVQRVAGLSALVFGYISCNKLWAQSEADLLTLALRVFLFYERPNRHFGGRDVGQRAEEFCGPVVRQTWTVSGCENAAQAKGVRGPIHTHTHTLPTTKTTNTVMGKQGDGRRWMAGSRLYDCRAVREDKRETDELPLYQPPDEWGSRGGERVK